MGPGANFINKYRGNLIQYLHVKFHGKLLWFFKLATIGQYHKTFYPADLLPLQGIGIDPIMTEKYLIALSQELRFGVLQLQKVIKNL